VDRVLLEEIELLSNLITAVGDARSPLTVGQLDSLLGVSDGATHHPACSAKPTQSAALQRRSTGVGQKNDSTSEVGHGPAR
jgi:hypothetical protein